jgi:hypothetical protein
MTYGLSARAYIEHGPTEMVARAQAQRSSARAWRILTEARRLAAIEQALRPARDRFDIDPPAL